jgi:competence protein ComEA
MEGRMTQQPGKDQENLPERFPVFLRRGDQQTLAVILVVLMLLMAVSTAWYAWRVGGLVPVDRLAPGQFRFQVDVNRADWPELTALPGIGETMARRIVAFRDTHGPFPSMQSLQQVQGIGPKTVHAMRPYVNLPWSGDRIAERQ